MASGRIAGSTTLHPNDYTFWIDWSSAKDSINNRSTVTATAYVKSNGSWDSDTVNSNFTQQIAINGNSASRNIRVNITKGGTVACISHSVVVPHNANGGKSITISANCRLGTAAYSPGVGTASQSVPLDTIDRAAPTVSLAASSISTTSLTITATANQTCNVWEYSANNGASYAQFSTTGGTSAEKTLTGLKPAATYSLKVRARKASNHVYGTSATKTVTTAEEKPGAPAAVFAVCDGDRAYFGNGPITVYWSGAKSPIKSYEIQAAVWDVKTQSWGPWADLDTVTTAATSGSYEDTAHSQVTAGSLVCYRVRACNGASVSAYTASASLERAGGIKVRGAAAWENGAMWVNAAGTWKRASYIWVNQAGTWTKSKIGTL